MNRLSGLCALLLSFMMVGCTAEKEENNSDSVSSVSSQISESEEIDYAETSKQLSIQMAEGDFSDTVEMFSDTVSVQLDEISLKQAWQQTVATIGGYVGFEEQSVSQNSKSTVVITTLRYENSGLNVRLSFDTEGKIDGIWINYCALTQNSSEYTETAIKIGEYELDGILTWPANSEDPPVAILVQGSGQTDMNETVGANKPFEDIAHCLAEKGIAVIRYNKRYYQYPQKSDENITVYDEITDDVSYAVDYAKSVTDGEIVLIGHSMGGMLAPYICSENPDIDKMISLAGSPRKLEDIILEQNENMLEYSDMSEDEKTKQLDELKTEVERIKGLSDEDKGNYFGVGAAYWRSLNEIDAAEIAKQLEIPMLFLQGSEDFQVSVKNDFGTWKTLLSDRSNCDFIEYEGLNHLFIKSNGQKDMSEYDIKENVSEDVTDDISEWINNT